MDFNDTNREMELRRQEIGRKLAEAAAAGQRGELIEGTPENLNRILNSALSDAAARKKLRFAKTITKE